MKLFKVAFDWSMMFCSPFFEVSRTPNSKIMFIGPVVIWWRR